MDLKNPRVIYFKGILFVIAGLVASAAILLEVPSLKIALLLGIAIWSFARAYYFAFYVIEHYVDRGFRYAGLVDFLKYVVKRKIRS
jgi:hypothetical protein